jgi:hypothetical protein
MAREIPEAVRAVAGLAATVLDEARKLPENLPGLPIRVLGMAMQLSMKLQQHYAGLVARGDELFTGFRGEDEPGMATFDDEEPAAASGARDSAFDRAAEPAVQDGDLDLVGAEASDATVAAALDASLEGEATQQVLDELAIEDLVEDRPVTEDADAVENALLESDRTALDSPEVEGITIDVVSPDGEVATTEAAVTDEGIAAPEGAADGPPSSTVTDTAGDAEASARAAAAAPVVVHAGEVAVDDAVGSGPATVQQSLAAPATPPAEGYDDFSIAQLRGRLRGYAAPTVQQLLDYEQATQAREPYLRMLRNRLEKLAAQ